MASPRHKKPGTSPSFAFFRQSALTLAMRSAICIFPAASISVTAHAQVADNAQSYSIPAGPLGQVLSVFAAKAGVQFSFDAGLTEGKSSKGLQGSYTVSTGFDRLLQGSGLRAQHLPGGGYTLQAIPVTSQPVAAPVSAAKVPEEHDLPVIDVVAQRSDSQLIRPTRQVNIIEREELEELREGSNSVATLLSKVVPGMADSSRTITDYGQTLRGRSMLVLVDGIPINTNRDSSRNLATINLGSIQRIEVLRGSSAIYGSGATGGVVSITTRPAGGEPYAETSVSLNSSLSKLRADSIGAEINHFLSGSTGVVDYAFNLGLQHIGGSYDGHGNRIAPEPSQGDLFDSNNYAIGGKLGFRIDRDQRLQFSISRYVADQDSDYASDPSVAKLKPGSAVAKPIKGLELDDQNQIRNTLVSANYQNADFFGSELSAQLYYRDYFTRFTPFDARALANRGNNIDQVMQNSDVLGGRLTLTTPIVESTKLVWGLDFNEERSDMPDDVFDPAAYDASGGTIFNKTGRVTYMPELTTRTIGAFGQLQHKVNEQWSFEGGVRYERSRAQFDDFVSLLESSKATPGTVQGGTIKYDEWLYNVGAIFKPVKNHEFYAAFSQGFQLPDIGVIIRNASAAFNVDSSSVKPVKTDNYEIGWRGTFGDVLGSLAIFQTTSKLGDVQSLNNGLVLLRTSEKIQGVEGSVDYLPAGNWSGGATFTYMEGRERPTGKPEQDMSGYRIPPLKVTGYVQYKPNEKWSNRLQVTYFGERDYRLKGVESFGRREVHSYTTVDLISRYAVTKKDTVTVGIENLFDRYYLPAYSQLLRNSNNTSRLPASGAVLRVLYNHVW